MWYNKVGKPFSQIVFHRLFYTDCFGLQLHATVIARMCAKDRSKFKPSIFGFEFYRSSVKLTAAPDK